MIAFRFNKKSNKAKTKATKALEKLDGVFRVVSCNKDGFAELTLDAKHKRVAKQMRGVKNVEDVEVFDFS